MGTADDGGREVGRRAPRAALATLGTVLLVPFVAFLVYHQFVTMVGATEHAVAEVEIAGRRVAMWKPVGAAPPDGYPIILFSHGFTGCGTQSVFLTEALAEAGYFVLAPNHFDAACGTGIGHQGELFAQLATTRSEQPFRKPDAWSDTTYHNRGEDMEAVLDAVLKEKAFQGVPIDSSRVGLAGHSLGGYTVLAMAGAWPSWKDRRVKAVLAVSPYCSPFLKKGNLAHLDVPVMYQGGTLDIGVTPYVRRLGGGYDLTSAPKYYIEFSGAGHFAWTNLNKTYQSVINDYAVAFFDRYLRGTPSPLTHLLDQPWPKDVSNLKYALK